MRVLEWFGRDGNSMLGPPKLLKVVTSPVEPSEGYMRLEVVYGITGFAGNLVLRLEDFAEFIEALRGGFDGDMAIAEKK